MRAMKEALKKQKEREKARVPIKGQAEEMEPTLISVLENKNTQSILRSKKKSKPLVFNDISERPSSEDRADQETKSLRELADTLDQLAEEYGQLALRQAMERKFADLPSSGQGLSKKQLNQIILDKNRVIADLEETAYSKGTGLKRDALRQLRKFYLRNTMTGRPMTEQEIANLELYSPADTVEALQELKQAYTVKHADFERQLKSLHARRKVLPYSMPDLISDIDFKIANIKRRMADLETDYEKTKKNLRTDQQNPIAETRFASSPAMETSVRPARLQARVQPVSAYRGAEELPVAQAFPEVYPTPPQEDPAVRRAMEASLQTRQQEEERSTGLGVKGKSESPWIKHIKAYQAKHGGSYKDAMKEASKSYKK
jgi:hypothetical protein